MARSQQKAQGFIGAESSLQRNVVNTRNERSIAILRHDPQARRLAFLTTATDRRCDRRDTDLAVAIIELGRLRCFGGQFTSVLLSVEIARLHGLTNVSPVVRFP